MVRAAAKGGTRPGERRDSEHEARWGGESGSVGHAMGGNEHRGDERAARAGAARRTGPSSITVTTFGRREYLPRATLS